MAPPQGARRFSMIRSLRPADFFTLANAACGASAVFAALAYAASGSIAWFYASAAMAPAALVFDFLDGRIARLQHAPSALGRELDSLADIVSFGVAPAALGHAAGLDGGWDWVVLACFVCCGVARLARFNVTAEALSQGSDKVAYFEGTPMPTTAVLTGLLAWAAWAGRLGEDLPGGVWQIGPAELHPFSLLFALSGALMVSTVRIPKL